MPDTGATLQPMQYRFFHMFALLLLAGVIGAQGCAVTYPDPDSGPANASNGKRR
jgi:hypothetical protein